MAEIVFRDVSKTYDGGAPAVNSVDLSIPSRALMVILGPSGSGKTTLLRMIAGLESPDSGSVWIDGHDVSAIPAHRRDVAMVFQNPALYPHLSVFENLAFGLKARGMPRNHVRAQVNTVAGLLGLDALLQRRPAQLSGGEKQRVAVGRALARQPRVLLCDEPFSDLDTPLRIALREEVAELHRQFGSTMVLVTHDQSEALLMGDQVAVLDRGRLLQVGTPRDVYAFPADKTVATFLGAPPMNILPCELSRGEDGTRLHLIAAGKSLSWAMPAGIGPEHWPESGQVELGIRPEAIAIHGESEPGTSVVLDAQIRRLEFEGPSVLATLSLGPHLLVARFPSGLPFHDRQHLQIVLDLTRAAWFDPDSGRALTRDRKEASPRHDESSNDQ